MSDSIYVVDSLSTPSTRGSCPSRRQNAERGAYDKSQCTPLESLGAFGTRLLQLAAALAVVTAPLLRLAAVLPSAVASAALTHVVCPCSTWIANLWKTRMVM